MMRGSWNAIVLPLCLALLPAPVFGETWFVSRNNVSGIEDGESWQTAFTAIQPAIDAADAAGGGEVWVAAGLYDEPRFSYPYLDGAVNTGSVVLKPDVQLYGGFLGHEEARDERDWAANETVIDGSAARDALPAYHVVLGADDAVLDGFIITGGNADLAEFSDDPRGYGGGMLNRKVSPTVQRCLFRDNGAIYGGAVCNGNASPIFSDCVFGGNAADYGGGMANFSAAPRLRDCGFSENEARFYGGGMANVNASPMLETCVFSANHAGAWGGGMAGAGTSSPTLTACNFEDNTAADWGGGIGNYSASPTLELCVFRNNSAQQWGGGMGNHRGDAVVIGCVFTGNAAGKWGGGAANYQSTPIFTDCEFEGNTAAYGAGVANHLSPPVLTNSTFANNRAVLYGGGMLNFKSSPEVRQCLFSGNQAESGGGMANGDLSAPALDDCAFHDNKAVWGGGIANAKSSPPLRNVQFTGNEAEKWGGGMVNFNGSAPAIADGSFTSNLSGEWGGAIANASSSPLVTACVFTGNRAEGGGGMANANAAPKVSDCVFQANQASGGAGMLNHRSSTTITDCAFEGNQAAFDGGGMANIDATPNIRQCVFSENQAGYAGGMFNRDANADVANCVFLANEAEHYGGGILNDGRILSMSNIVFARNSAAVGGGMVNGDASPELYHCTFAHNRALGSPETHVLGGGIANWDASPALLNSILWGNEGGEIESGGEGAPSLRYCNVGGGYPGAGNMDVHPMFVDPDAGNYRLRPVSPCVDVGTMEGNAARYDFDGIFRLQGRGVDLGPYEYIIPGEPFHKLRLDSSGPGTTIPPSGTYEIQNGSVIPLLAIPETNGKFSKWRGLNLESDASQAELSLPMDQDRNVTAYFLQDNILFYERTVHGLDENGFLVPGTQTLDISITVTRLQESGRITAFGIEEEFPPNWTFAGIVTASSFPPIYPSADWYPFEFGWISAPSLPFSITYRVNVPAQIDEPVTIQGHAMFRLDASGELTSNEAVTVIQVAPEKVIFYERTVHGLDENGFLVPGTQTLDISTTVTRLQESGMITALGIEEEFPPNWTFAGIVTASSFPPIYPAAADRYPFEFAWISPPSLPLNITYRVNVPAQIDGPVTIQGRVLFRMSGTSGGFTSNEAASAIQVASAAEEKQALEDAPGEGIEASMTPGDTPEAVVYAPGAAMSAVRTLFAREEIPEDPIRDKRCKRLPLGCGANDGANHPGGLAGNLLLMMGALAALLAAHRRHGTTPRGKQ